MNEKQLTIIRERFSWVSDEQVAQLDRLCELYQEWNTKINVISRKDIDNVFDHHILHSMSIALFCRFNDGTKVIDVGTGGGLPGIPLAILFPKVQFTLIDSIAKKITVASEIITSLGLKNAVTFRGRAEEYTGGKGHFVVSRGAMQMDVLVNISKKLVQNKEQINALPNGVIALKGGDLQEELKPFRRIAMEEDISNFLPNIDFFETKKIVYLPL